MSTSSSLESEDLENVSLVRMEDVQPSRPYESISRRRSDEEELETCVIEDIEYDNECIVNDDDDSNIGSMVSIQSEEVIDEDNEAEMIVPEPLDIPVDLKVEKSWPTLEIEGGVIKKPQNQNTRKNSDLTYYDDCPSSFGEDRPGMGEMMYACAKCSKRFQYLFCLVKHVKWHEDEAKKQNGIAIRPIQEAQEYDCMHSNKRKVLCTKSHKKKSPKKRKS